MASATRDPSSPDLQRVQQVRKAVLATVLAVTVVALCCADSFWRFRAPDLYEAIEWFGVVLIFVCIAGRTWCTLYIGGRKKDELVTLGPYSLVRNPLYVFTLIGAFGIGAQFASIVVAIVMTAIAAAVFRTVVAEEEAFLAKAFPDDWARYSRDVARFMPRFRLWRDTEQLTIKPALVVKTFLDACLFALAIPGADLIETAQAHGYLPVLLLLP
ncbi:MAG: methyltransferase family protein [Hyphomicrobium sp.]